MSLGQMNKREAESLVEGVLTGPYSEADFRKLVVNIFPDMEAKSDRWTGAYVPEAFRSGVAQYGRLGKVEDAEGYTVDILAVKLKNAGTLERARTLQRNFVARYLNGGRGDALRDAALVAFYADGTPDWRFSLVRMDYTLDETKNKVRKDFTPARRYSFLVGGNEKTHTARKQLATVLQGDAQTTLTELERAFNIESVTKEFFEKYKTLYLNLKEELDGLERADPRIRGEFTAKHIDTATFAKRLLGQIVFLYFLQKKGWLGVGRNADGSLEPWGVGPKDFLRRLFKGEVVPYDNFFDDLLEPLFYEALASDRGEQSFYSRFNCRIPFLNGGLFEPVGDYNWAETRINLKNETFGQIFDTFDLYNFTVREDEPLDKEVAVDPEMLGKVFENLLEVKDRKSKGAFYTPREIVHYMCQESLINYLDTALNTVIRPLTKQAPSQADLFGRPRTEQAPLTEEVYEERVPRADIAEFIRLGDAAQEHDAATATRVRETDAYSFKVPESVRQHAKQLDEALADIKICDPAIGSGAFPVGMMNEIVRARGALNAYLGNENRTAYDFKRHAIQESIYGVDIEESAVDIAKLRLWLSLIVDEDDYGTIKPLPNLEYKIVIGNSLLGVEETLFNNDLFERLERLKGQYFSETRQGEKGRLKGEIAALIQELTRGEVDFDFKVYFSEVFQEKGGFDIVIGNPPYVDSEEMVRSQLMLREQLTRAYETAVGNWDLFVVFIESGIKLLGKRGVITYIVPNKLVSARYTEALRRFVSRLSIIELRDYSKIRVFAEADVYPVVFFIQRTAPVNPVVMTVMENVSTVGTQSMVDADAFGQDIFWDRHFSDNPDSLQIIEKLLSFPQLGQLGEVTGAATVGEAYEVKKLLQDGSHSSVSRKKFINTGTIDRYMSLWGLKDTRYIKGGYLHPSIEDGDLAKMSRTRLLQAEAEKIVVGGMTKVLECFYDEGQYLAGKSTMIFLSKRVSLKFILGLLNSKLITFFYSTFFKSLSLAGGYLRLGPPQLKKIPIRTINPSDPTDKAMHDRMVALVERMLSLHEEKGQVGARPGAELDAEIRRTDAEIDRLVYELYGLTDEEVAIVEGSGAR